MGICAASLSRVAGVQLWAKAPFSGGWGVPEKRRRFVGQVEMATARLEFPFDKSE
jgi:hypothetical protein